MIQQMKVFLSGSRKLQLVFISSCHSRAMGDMFLRAGVDYAVCIRAADQVMDKASIMFAKMFYQALLSVRH